LVASVAIEAASLGSIAKSCESTDGAIWQLSSPRHKNIMQTRFAAPRFRLAGQQEKRNDACQFESHPRNLDKKPLRI
jgi:hypothetical protein